MFRACAVAHPVFTATAQARRPFPVDRRPAPEYHLSTANFFRPGLVAPWMLTTPESFVLLCRSMASFVVYVVDMEFIIGAQKSLTVASSAEQSVCVVFVIENVKSLS